MQRILHGIRHLHDVLHPSSKVLLVCGSSFRKLPIRETVISAPVSYTVFSHFSPNPSYEAVCQGIELFNQAHCDTILAVGGGSAIDVAKCIKLFSKKPKGTHYLDQPYEDTGIPLIAIPTTAGSGSESTRYAVIYDQGEKQSITHESIIPDVAILDASILATLPPYQRRCTMMDALCQAIESWWSVHSTDESKRYAREAVETIMRWWHEYIFANHDQAAFHLMTAANKAGQAINITQTTAPHAFSYKLSTMYGLPHGHAVAICLPAIWRDMLHHPERCKERRGAAYLDTTFHEIAQAMGAASPSDAILQLESMEQEMGLHRPISHHPASDLDILVHSVNPIRLSNNPTTLPLDVIHTLYGHLIIPSRGCPDQEGNTFDKTSDR